MVEEINNELSEVKDFNVGDVVQGTITKVEDKIGYADVGFKVDGIIPISELSILHVEKASDVISVGDQVELKIIKLEDDEMVLSKRGIHADKVWDDFDMKLRSGEPFDVEVAEVVKGGLVVDVGVRGFIPASLVEQHFVEDFSQYKGMTIKVMVAEIDRENNKLILSRRAVLDAELGLVKKEAINNIKPGQVIEGKVQRITKFGAFVEVNGVDGLVHISQMSHQHVESPADVVKEGDQVKVKVLSVDAETERISLSIKDTLPGPWERVGGNYTTGDIIEGTVKRLVSFGAFVEVENGVEGLVHISQIANRHIATPNEVLKEGQVINAKILDMNLDEKRISLSIRALEEEADAKDREEYTKNSNDSSGFSLGERLGDQLKNYK
jgi:small subunit ribosomal protein S1